MRALRSTEALWGGKWVGRLAESSAASLDAKMVAKKGGLRVVQRAAVTAAR